MRDEFLLVAAAQTSEGWQSSDRGEQIRRDLACLSHSGPPRSKVSYVAGHYPWVYCFGLLQMSSRGGESTETWKKPASLSIRVLTICGSAVS